MERSELNVLVGSNLRRVRKDKFLVLAAKVAVHIILFYGFSIMMSVFNSYIISKNQYNFSFPLFITSMQTIFHFFVTSIISYYFLDTEEDKIFEEFVESRQEESIFKKYYPIILCGIAAGLDIGLSNYSLKIISLSFYTMVKSSTPIFILLFSFLMKLEKPTKELIAIIGMIGIGVFLTSWTENKFEMFGFFIVMTASFMSGLRWTLTQILLQKTSAIEHENNPIKTMRKISPVVSVTLLICSLAFEGLDKVFNSEFFNTPDAFVRSSGIICTGGTIAFFLILIEFRLIAITSVITLSICGIFKEILTITVSVAIFGDKILPINIVGLVISISGIIGYNIFRYRKFMESRRSNIENKRRFRFRRKNDTGYRSLDVDNSENK